MKKNKFGKIINYLNPYNPNGGSLHVKRDWFVLLIFFILALFGGICFGYLTYLGAVKVVSQETILPENSVVSVNKSLIKKTIDDIHDKEERFNTGFTIEVPKDPSL